MLLVSFYSVETLCNTFAFDILADSRKGCEGCVQGPLGWERVGWRGGGDSGKVSGGRAEAA